MIDGGPLTLPSGGVVTLRPITELRSGDRIDVLKSVGKPEDLTVLTVDVTLRLGCAAALITSWALPYEPDLPLPKDDPASLRRLEIGDFTALMDAVGPAITVLFPAPPTPDDAGTPGSPTEPAGD